MTRSLECKASGEGLPSPALSLRPNNAVHGDYNHHTCEHGRHSSEPYCGNSAQNGRETFAVIEHIGTTQAACFLGMHTHLLKVLVAINVWAERQAFPDFALAAVSWRGTRLHGKGANRRPNSELGRIVIEQYEIAKFGD